MSDLRLPSVTALDAAQHASDDLAEVEQTLGEVTPALSRAQSALDALIRELRGESR